MVECLTAHFLDVPSGGRILSGMSSTNTDQTNGGIPKDKPETKMKLPEDLREPVTKGLSQPPSKSQVPPATASEELVQ